MKIFSLEIVLAASQPDPLPPPGEGLNIAIEKVDGIIEGFFRVLPNLAIGMQFFIVVLVFARLIKHAVRQGVIRRGRPDLGNVLATLVQWIVGTFGFLLAITIIVPGVGVANLITTLGITSVAIGFAFKDILENLLAGILILLRNPFRRGDQIVAGNFEGTVERIETRATLIRTYDGRQVLIPNSKIYTASVVINTAFETRRSECDLGIAYDADIGRAVTLVLETLSGIEGVLETPPPQAFTMELAPWTVNLRIWWWTAPDQKSMLLARGRVLAALKGAFAREGIDLPPPVPAVVWHDQIKKDSKDGNENHRE